MIKVHHHKLASLIIKILDYYAYFAITITIIQTAHQRVAINYLILNS